jgi:putative hydrolase of HD superfamily
MSFLEPLLTLLPLDRLPRTGWVLAGIEAPESIAGHVLGTAHLALALAPQVEPELELAQVLAMALVHDVAEARSGDLPRGAAQRLPEGAKAAMEDTLARELLTPLGDEARAAYEAYRAGSTREARLVALCDKLQLGVRLVGYLRAGHAGLRDFEGGLVELDATEFEPAEALRLEIVAALGSSA